MPTKEIAAPSRRDVAVKSDSNALMSLIERAASDPNFDVTKLDHLLQVKERWEKEEARKSFVSALADFKSDPPEVFKNKKVSFKETAYKHATLDQASSIIGASLSKHGLSHRWSVTQDAGKIKVTCVLTHVAGHSESVTLESMADQSGSKNAIQSIGSAVSYLQRYSLFAVTGIAAKDMDDDGAKSSPRRESRPAETIPGPEEAIQTGTDSFKVLLPVVTKKGAALFFKGGQRPYRIDAQTAKDAKANFKDGDTASVEWAVTDGDYWVNSLSRIAAVNDTEQF